MRASLCRIPPRASPLAHANTRPVFACACHARLARTYCILPLTPARLRVTRALPPLAATPHPAPGDMIGSSRSDNHLPAWPSQAPLAAAQDARAYPSLSLSPVPTMSADVTFEYTAKTPHSDSITRMDLLWSTDGEHERGALLLSDPTSLLVADRDGGFEGLSDSALLVANWDGGFGPVPAIRNQDGSFQATQSIPVGRDVLFRFCAHTATGSQMLLSDAYEVRNNMNVVAVLPNGTVVGSKGAADGGHPTRSDSLYPSVTDAAGAGTGAGIAALIAPPRTSSSTARGGVDAPANSTPAPNNQASPWSLPTPGGLTTSEPIARDVNDSPRPGVQGMAFRIYPPESQQQPWVVSDPYGGDRAVQDTKAAAAGEIAGNGAPASSPSLPAAGVSRPVLFTVEAKQLPGDTTALYMRWSVDNFRKPHQMTLDHARQNYVVELPVPADVDELLFDFLAISATSGALPTTATNYPKHNETLNKMILNALLQTGTIASRSSAMPAPRT
ncbi:hypothetical protein M427DRAFT_74512 [Gonapodya prolifera JEL478]|uniref:Uncharacterized protein n=1 Tax=Gonapodya prolifera (strain JEL478) TaxID=1344416 RepID=A0A139A0S2_GONPJ|nr:hypothetical protein M427DRAFT_74512 [Gonapodya prolifera JEL478]|eukprot:KXS10125.1 hypothetical protein M427DRAFT_74512 [Gonapodya prolifera JEL478]